MKKKICSRFLIFVSIIVLISVSMIFIFFNNRKEKEVQISKSSSQITENGKDFDEIKGDFEDISKVYEKIKAVYKDFDINSYIVEKDEVESKVFYTLYKKINGGKTLNGYVITVEDKKYRVSKSEGNRFDINVENTISSDTEFKNIDDFLSKNAKDKTELKLLKTDLVYQDEKLYNAYSILISYDGVSSVITIYEEKK